MQVHKFVFKFIDHATDSPKREGRVKIISVEAHCHKHEVFEPSRNWEAEKKHHEEKKKWKHALKHKIWEHIKKKHPEIEQYKVIKEKSCKESEAVNISTEPGHENIKLLKVFCYSLCVKKLAKGNPPNRWTDVFNYDHICHHVILEFHENNHVPQVLCEFVTHPRDETRIIPREQSKWGLSSHWTPQGFSQQSETASLNRPLLTESSSRRFPVGSEKFPQTQPEQPFVGGEHWDNSSDQPGGYRHKGDLNKPNDKNKHRGSKTPHTESSDWKEQQQKPHKYY